MRKKEIPHAPEKITVSCPYCGEILRLNITYETTVFQTNVVQPSIRYNFEEHSCPKLERKFQ